MAKKTTTKTKGNPPAKPSPAKAARTYDISSLSAQLGAADQAFAKRTFLRAREEDLVSEGTRTDSQNILDDIPRFVGSSMEILERLSQKQRNLVKLPSAILPLLIQEVIKLQKDKANHDAGRSEAAGEKAERESASRAEMRSGISERDLCYDALRNALGDDRRSQLDEIVGTADTPENLALGLEALARFLDKMREGAPDDALSLADYGLDAAYAESLRKKAAKVRDASKITAAPSRKVTQRALDLQDGRVLYLIEKVIRSFRAARRADPTILVPELNKIAWMFETRSGKAKGAETPAAAPTEGQPK